MVFVSLGETLNLTSHSGEIRNWLGSERIILSGHAAPWLVAHKTNPSREWRLYRLDKVQQSGVNAQILGVDMYVTLFFNTCTTRANAAASVLMSVCLTIIG